MRRGQWAKDADKLLAMSDQGVIRVAELDRLGVPPRTSYRRCLPGGHWRWLLPGIVQLSKSPPTTAQRLAAAFLHCGADAVLTGTEAARRHGMRNLPEQSDLHLLIGQHRKVQSTGFVHVERTIHLPEPVVRNGVRLAPLSRAVLDCVRRIRLVDPVRALLSEAVQRGHCSPTALLTELDEGSQRGSALPRRVLVEIAQGARSVAEAHGLALWHRAKLPTAHWNVPVFDQLGQLIAVPDAWCDEVALAWEIDSFEFHFERDGYARTLSRNARYAAAGVTVVQTLPSMIRDEPGRVVSELRAAYAAASARPRPPIHM